MAEKEKEGVQYDVFAIKCLKMGGGLTWLITVSSCVLWFSITVSKTII